MDCESCVCLVEVKKNGSDIVGYAVSIGRNELTDALFGKLRPQWLFKLVGTSAVRNSNQNEG